MGWIPPVDDNFCIQIGRIIVRWSDLERRFDEFLGMMRKASDTTEPQQWQKLPLEKRYTQFKAQAQLCFGAFAKILSELNVVTTNMPLLQVDRDLIAHGRVWLLWPANVLQAKRRRPPDVERFYSAADLAAIDGLITHLSSRLSRLTDEREHDQLQWSQQELSALRGFLERSR